MLNLYVIYDRLAGEAGPIFQAKNHSVACRNFTSFLNSIITDKNSAVNVQDFVLYWVGVYNPEEPSISREVPTVVEFDMSAIGEDNG